MNENGGIIELSSDSDDDSIFGDDHQPASAITSFDQNEGRIINFEDEDWQRSAPAPSSVRPTENNGQYRILPASVTNGRNAESSRYTVASGDRIRPYPSSHMAMRQGLSTSSRIDSSSTADANDNNKRVLPPSFSNGNASKSMHPIAASETRKLSPHFSTTRSPNVGENRMGTNIANGNLQPSSSIIARGSSSTLNTQKVDDDDDVVYGGSTSHRVLPPMVGATSSNNSEVANGFETRNRLNPENRVLDYDERAVYQEALQNISREKREDDLPEGVLAVSLLKHQKMALAWMVSKENSSHCAGGILADDQGLGKTVSTIALIQKQRNEQSKFMSVDSDRLKSEALNLDEDDEGEQTVSNEPNKDQGASSSSTAAGTSAELCVNQPNNVLNKMVETKAERKKKAKASTSSASTSRSMTRPAAGTLVVCPASVLKQWANELTDKVSESAKLSVLVYHGGARTKDPSELAKYDVVVTTYTIVANEVPKQMADDNADQKNSEEPSAGNKRKPPANMQNKAKKKKKKLKDSNFDLDSGPIARVRWFRVVLDEAQTIKNFRTVVARACCGLRAKRRWCLSGTPIQNAIDELYSYFRFLKYDPYSTYNSFCTMIKHPIARDAVHGYKKLQAVLRVVLLRRTKETLINGKPIINLPPKTINLNKVDFTQEERSFYLMLEERSRQQFKAFAAAGTLKQNYANILLMLLRLRQACDHPILVKGNQSEYGGDGSIEMAKKLPKNVVIDLLAKLEVGSACSLCEDTPEDAIVTICGHVFCYQCIHERITTDETMCPAPNCSRTLGFELLFSSGALKICVSGESSSAGASSSADNDSSSISQISFVSSKIQAAIDILNKIINMNALTESDTMESNRSGVTPVKAIVFSQWTGMLDLLELSLNNNLIQYRRLDGTMSLNLRDKAVKDFNTDPEVRVMIMSLKAGNLGLNMVAACHVILLDLWWNPYAEDQAVDRAHRIGQTRPVTVSRLTVKDTVEDRILALQQQMDTSVSTPIIQAPQPIDVDAPQPVVVEAQQKRKALTDAEAQQKRQKPTPVPASAPTPVDQPSEQTASAQDTSSTIVPQGPTTNVVIENIPSASSADPPQDPLQAAPSSQAQEIALKQEQDSPDSLFSFAIDISDDDGEEASSSLALGTISSDTYGKLETLLNLLQQETAQLVIDSDPAKSIFKAIRGQVPSNVEEIIFPAVHLESRQLQYQRAVHRIADRAAQSQLKEEMLQLKQTADEKHKNINNLQASSADIRQKISDLSAKKAALLAELEQVETALTQAKQEEDQLPDAIKALQQERDAQARKALALKKKVKPVEGNADEDAKELKEADEIRLRAISAIQALLNSA